MTVKEIAEAVGRDIRNVNRWIQKIIARLDGQNAYVDGQNAHVDRQNVDVINSIRETK